MKKYFVFIWFAFLIILYSCGGGGGGGGTTGGVTSSSVTIGGTAVGTVGLSSLVGASKADFSKSADGYDRVGAAKVVIESYHHGRLDKKYETATDPALGTFSLPIELWSDGGYIIVYIMKNGLVTYSKTFNYSKPEDLKGLNLKAEIAPYLAKAVTFNNISATDFFKSAEEDTLSIAIVQNSKGVKKLATNNEIKVAKASGSVVRWQMDLSKSMLKAASSDIGDSIVVKAQNYNPTNEEDMKSFPTEADTAGNKLVSTAFDYIDIKTATGKSFCVTKDGKYGTLDASGNCTVSSASAAKQSELVRKTAVAKFNVKRQIDDCEIAKRDEDTTKPGKQVGFYVSLNGKWYKIGNATLYKSSAFQNLNWGEFEDTLYFSDSDTCQPNDRPYAVFTEDDLKKASKDLGFDLSWYNFDYVAMGDLRTFCIEGEFKKAKKNEKSPLPNLYLYLNDLRNNNATVTGFRSTNGYTDENGKFKIEGVTSTVDSDYEIVLSYTDPFTFKWIEKKKKLKARGASGCYQVDIEEVTDPFECTVTGRAKKSDGSIYANKYLYAYVKDKWFGYQSTYTDSNGLYTLPVICGENYVLTDGVDSFDFKVNGTISPPETDDTGKQVVLNPQFPNHPPYAYAYANKYSIKTGETVQLYGYAWDPDGDSLSYSWSGSGTFSSTSTQNPTWTAPTSDGTYGLTLRVTDSGGLSSDTTVTIEVSTVNRPPRITYLYVPTSVVEGNDIYLYASAYDPDGDTLTYSWSVSPSAGNFNSTSTQNPIWTAPSVSSQSTYNITLSVSDGTNVTSQNRPILVYPDTPPVIVSNSIPTNVTPGSSNAISAYAYDPEGKAVTYSWTISGGTPASSISSYFSWTAPSQEGDVTIDLTVSDGSKSASLGQKIIKVKRQNTAPSISTFTVPSTGVINEPITISATATDAENDTLTFSFYVDGNLIDEKTPTTIATKAATASTTWRPRIRKSYTIMVVVSDGALTARRSQTFTVTNTSPMITNVSVPSTATAGTAVTFSATAEDADGDPLTYTWFAGTTQIGTGGASLNWTPTAGGTYSITVRVSDGTATVTSSPRSINVNTRPVVSDITVSPSSPQTGQTVTLTAVATDADGDTLTYEWYIQNVKQSGTGASITWTPSSAGTYTVEVRVSDGKVATPVSFTKTIDVTGAVTNQPPSTPTISVTAGAGQYTLSATATDPDNGPYPLKYTWYIDGSLLGTGHTIVWPVSTTGTYSVRVVVSDGAATVERTQSVTVTITTNIIIN